MELFSKATTAAATTRTTAADNDVPAEVCVERDQAGRGHLGTRAERETCPKHPVRGRSPNAHASGASAAEQQAHAAPATAAEDEEVEPTSTNDEPAEMSPATQELRTKDNGAGIGDLFSEDAEEFQVAPTEDLIPKGLEDLFKGELPAEPWQHKRYSPDNRIWQAAAMRRRQHARRSNVSLGVCTVDLSGPHEPSPRPGKQIHRDTGSYFRVLAVRPDQTADTSDVAVQTRDVQADRHEPQPNPPDQPLLYAALFGSKAEATEAIKLLLAKINDDHGNLPRTLYFRLHSDKGG